MSLKKLILLSIPLCLLFTQCNYTVTVTSHKTSEHDPFKNSIISSEYFEIDADEDNVISGAKGSTIVCPKGCFIDSKGDIFDGDVKIELAEALTLDDMILSNLTTTSGGHLIETDGMIYFNATGDGHQLNVNPEIPVHIEMPTSEKKAGMMAYKGSRDEEGNMEWSEPKELNNYLTTVDLNSLDFLPEGFQNEVEKGMPFKGHSIATPALTDSLYFSLKAELKPVNSYPADPVAEYNEPYYNKHKITKNGKYTDDSYNVKSSRNNDSDEEAYHTKDSSHTDNCGINPAYIKVIKSGKYQNTLIATREFESRLKVIFKSCNNTVLAYYINNTGKKLYELDSMAAILLKGTKYEEAFKDFAEQKLTNVKNADKYARLLNGYFEKQLAKINKELEEARNELKKESDKKNEQANKVAEKYKKLLFKRESFRMEKYNYEWTATGWINIDRGPDPKDWGPQPLQVKVENGAEFDRVYTYVIYTTIKSLYRLNGESKIQFYVGNDDEKSMLMPKHKNTIAIAIGYKGETPSIAARTFISGMEPEISLTLLPTTILGLKKEIKGFDSYSKENKISVDLEYMSEFYMEELRQKELMKETEFMLQLWNKAFPCCADKIDGGILFKMNCASCHSIGYKAVGPDLANITSSRTPEWLYQFTRNNEKLRQSGDKDAIAVYNENGKAAMNVFENLSREEIEAIYQYIATVSNRLNK